MIKRAIAVSAIFLLTVQIATGCRTMDKMDLPEDRRVRTVTFPVRPLKFVDLRCVQQLDRMELSGGLVNISSSALSHVRLETEIFYSQEHYGEMFNVPVTPSFLQPGQMGTFTLLGDAEKPVSHVELHARWETFIPSGF